MNQELNVSHLIGLFRVKRPTLKIFKDKTKAQFEVGVAIGSLIDGMASRSRCNGGFDRKELMTILKSVTSRYAEELSKEFTGSEDSVVLFAELYQRSWKELSNRISEEEEYLFELRQTWLEELRKACKQQRNVSAVERLYGLCEYFRIDLSDLLAMKDTIRAIS